MNDFQERNVINKLGTLTLILSRIFLVRRNISFNLAVVLKVISHNVMKYQDKPFEEGIENPLNRIDVVFCTECTNGLELNSDSIETLVDILIAEQRNLATVCYLSDEKNNVGISFDCEHEARRIISIDNNMVHLYEDEMGQKKLFLKYFDKYGTPLKAIGAKKVKDYELVLNNLKNLIETRGFKRVWVKRDDWLLINKPEELFHDRIYYFLHDRFIDGRVEEEIELSGGSLDFKIHGESLPHSSVLIELKWVGESLSNPKTGTSIKFSTSKVKKGIEQVRIYCDGYNSQSYKIGAPYVMIVDAEKTRKAFSELETYKSEVSLIWARLEPLSPSKKSKIN